MAGGVRLAGVDGCRGGWAVVTAGLGPGHPVEVRVDRDLTTVVADVAAGRLAVAAVDVPIGLAATGPRRCDLEARALLGARRSTVFPAPLRAVLGSQDYAEACARSRAASGGTALSLQAFHLLGRIAEVDRVLPQHLAHRVVESHPELAFVRLAGGCPVAPKRSPEGRRRRLELLAPVLGPQVDLAGAARAARVPLLDAVDAAALVATARRLAAGDAELLGGDVDATGRVMQVAW